METKGALELQVVAPLGLQRVDPVVVPWSKGFRIAPFNGDIRAPFIAPQIITWVSLLRFPIAVLLLCLTI